MPNPLKPYLLKADLNPGETPDEHPRTLPPDLTNHVPTASRHCTASSPNHHHTLSPTHQPRGVAASQPLTPQDPHH